MTFIWATRIFTLGVLLLLSLVHQASAICAGGFDFGISEEIPGQQGALNQERI
ncbi:hypothetical protein K435DRAFT_881372 [Dendrothele bispora CBS 962.96]|uniref:Uncharacterized protein n=1 Tax=Dendrothele bispora (strain CBS 962.96) TaxID=1314807 RepID=A0A4S8KIE6_DENBC|nr:hypothetical protein K435DRAFT_881372 [Dendrothele bispora CBS 962.96]